MRASSWYDPRHLRYWLQIKKPHQSDRSAITVAPQDGWRVDAEDAGSRLPGRHHSGGRQRPVQADPAEWRPRFQVRNPAGRSFNIAAVDRVKPCAPPVRRRPNETFRQYIHRAVREHHGHTLPQSWHADLDAIPDGDTGEPRPGYLVGADNPTPHEKALLHTLVGKFGDRPAGNAADTEDRRSQ